VDAYTPRDGILDVGILNTTTSGQPGYPSGKFFALNATGQGRDADLAATWWQGNIDVAFYMAFSNKSEPPPPNPLVDPSSTIAVVGSCR
jgi:hypothetical protein